MKIRLLITLIGGVLPAMFCGCRHTEPHYETPPAAAHGPAKPLAMTPIPNRLDPVWLRPPTNLFTLGPGDKLELEMMDETNSTITTVVGPDGKVYFDLLPGIDVWGMTLSQVKATMEQELSKYVRNQPRVNITLREVGSKHVWLLGRFQQPGVYPMAGPLTLLEAISMAGGSMTFVGTRDLSGGPLGEDLADFRRSFIVRNGKLLPVDFERLLLQGDLSQNIYLQPDDFVYFAPASAKEVYVLGAVGAARPVQYVAGLTLIGAIASAGGTVRDAYLSHVAVVRGSLAEPKIAVVDYYEIVKGHVADIPLEAHDIVYVPYAPYRYLRKYLDVALDAFANSVAINAGTRVSGGQGNVSISVGGGTTTTPSLPPVGR